jgi:hypothetical protein
VLHQNLGIVTAANPLESGRTTLPALSECAMFDRHAGADVLVEAVTLTVLSLALVAIC